MIDMTSHMQYQISNLNVENERIAYQMSSGKVLNNGSDDSIIYAQTLDIENNIRVYEGLQTQIEKTIAQNNVSDNTMDEVKATVDLIKVDLMKSLNAGMDESALAAIATNIEGLRENLLTISNVRVDGEYLFAGSDTTKETFTKDANFALNGKVDFGGDAMLRKVAVEPATYRERGISGYDVLMHNADTASAGEQLTFNVGDRIIDENGQEWKMNQTDTFTIGGTVEADDLFTFTVGGESITASGADEDAVALDLKAKIEANNSLNSLLTVTVVGAVVTVVPKVEGENFVATITTTETDGTQKDTQTFTHDSVSKIQQYDKQGVLESPEVKIDMIWDESDPGKYKTTAGEITGSMLLESKHSFFDDLNVMINALKGYATNTDGTQGVAISKDEMNTILTSSLETTANQFDASNVGHAELGGRNNIFNISLERLAAKTVHYNILMQEVGSADLAKLAMESKSLEMTYQALYSTISKMNSLSLLNYIK